jgi:hypothetical protein
VPRLTVDVPVAHLLSWLLYSSLGASARALFVSPFLPPGTVCPRLLPLPLPLPTLPRRPRCLFQHHLAEHSHTLLQANAPFSDNDLATSSQAPHRSSPAIDIATLYRLVEVHDGMGGEAAEAEEDEGD